MGVELSLRTTIFDGHPGATVDTAVAAAATAAAKQQHRLLNIKVQRATDTLLIRFITASCAQLTSCDGVACTAPERMMTFGKSPAEFLRAAHECLFADGNTCRNSSRGWKI
jgi:hypothetical protein